MPDRDEIVDDLRGLIEAKVYAGFDTRDEMIEQYTDYLYEHGHEEGAAALAARITDEALATHQTRQSTWPDTTDCDRLDAAFETLERRGIVCRQNFSCCGTCGSAEIWDEMKKTYDAGQPVVGYAFFHMQDTESAVKGCGLYLNYGATEEGEDAALAVAQEVVVALNDSGFVTDWNGQWSTRIRVAIDWKRRRPIEVRGTPSPGLFDNCE